ncbi:hypothetical protein FRC02_008687 [Tulasnella sp. 418]|nr:hypothetical protein FRC02_008687 [Tulasnella sp. 418]
MSNSFATNNGGPGGNDGTEGNEQHQQGGDEGQHPSNHQEENEDSERQEELNRIANELAYLKNEFNKTLETANKAMDVLRINPAASTCQNMAPRTVFTAAHPSTASSSRRRGSSLTSSPRRSQPYPNPQRAPADRPLTTSPRARHMSARPPSTNPFARSQPTLPSISAALQYNPTPQEPVQPGVHIASVPQRDQTGYALLPSVQQNFLQGSLNSNQQSSAMHPTSFVPVNPQAGGFAEDHSAGSAANRHWNQSSRTQQQDVGQTPYHWQIRPIASPVPRRIPSRALILQGLVPPEGSGASTSHYPEPSRTVLIHSTPVDDPAQPNLHGSHASVPLASGSNPLLDDNVPVNDFVALYGVPQQSNRMAGRVVESGGSMDVSVNNGTHPSQPGFPSLDQHQFQQLPHWNAAPHTGVYPHTGLPLQQVAGSSTSNSNSLVNDGVLAQPPQSVAPSLSQVPHWDAGPYTGVEPNSGNGAQLQQVDDGPLAHYWKEFGDGSRG